MRIGWDDVLLWTLFAVLTVAVFAAAQTELRL